MYKTTDFSALPVLSLADCAIIGNVNAVLFDLGAKGAQFFEISADGQTMLLGHEKVICKNDALVIDSMLSLVDECDVDMTALIALDGKAIYSQNGEHKGDIINIELFANGKTSKILTETGAYSPSAFQKCGDVLLLKPAKKRTIRHSIPRDKTNRKVQIFENNTLAENTKAPVPSAMSQVQSEVLPQDEVLPKKPAFIEQNAPLFSQDALEKIVGKEVVYQADDERTPARIISDYDFLLGRTLLHDLLTYAGTLLAPEGSTVTKELVETAARYGKLVDLTLNSSYK